LGSIIDVLGTKDFPRLRLGIGPLPPQWKTPDFVLSKFTSAEKTVVEGMVEQAARTIVNVLTEGMEKAVSKMPGKQQQ
jgi:PTH1 family peptidyl-tRNA hydrolase